MKQPDIIGHIHSKLGIYHKSTTNLPSLPGTFLDYPIFAWNHHVLRKVSYNLPNKCVTKDLQEHFINCEIPRSETNIIGEDYSDPPSVLHLENDIEESCELSKHSIKDNEQTSSARQSIELTKSTATAAEKVNHNLRVLSEQFDAPKYDWLYLQLNRSITTKVCKSNIEDLAELSKSSETYREFLYTLFYSIKLIKEINPKLKEVTPPAKLDLVRPEGLLSTFNE